LPEHHPRRTTPSRPRALADSLEPRLLLATFTVTSNGIAAGSLRQAITDANASPGADRIVFNMPGTAAPATTIRGSVPVITGPLDIDGTTQPGYAVGKPVVHYLGAASTSASDGLVFNNAGACRVRGLIVNNWGGSGIKSSGNTQIVIEGNWVGLDPSGALPVSNKIGINIQSGGARVGGTTDAQRNVISGNSAAGAVGLLLDGDDNVVTGNYVGTTWQGNNPLPNQVGISIGGARNRVGGTTAPERNVISGNATGVSVGRYVPGGVRTSVDNVVQGNYIGTNWLANLDLPNTTRGVYVTAGSDRAVIGGTAPGAGNVISGNVTGVEVAYSGGFADPPDVLPPRATRVEGNLIGLNPSGFVIANTTGIAIRRHTFVGGTTAAARNVISGNGTGILVAGESFGIQGNYIGTSLAGTAARPNGVGILIDYSVGTRVGGTEPGAGNVISGNTAAGIRIARVTPPGSPINFVEGNRIGTNAAGTAAVGNGVGVEVTAGTVVIGGDTDAARNVISGNAGDGVRLGASGAAVRRNYIGTTADGNAPLGNTGHGVFGAAATLVGCAVESNAIAHNGGDGIRWLGDRNNPFLSNSIHDNGGLGIDLGGDGVTPNDHLDPDTGPNARQNFPVLGAAVSDAAQSTVTGTLDSRANTAYRIQFFSGPVADASGYGEGATYLGEVTVTTTTTGAATFTATLPAVQLGHAVTATASRVPAANETPFPETSEFSAAVTVAAPDRTGPRVTGVYVGALAWTSAFCLHLQDLGIGGIGLGYLVPDGPAQLATLPWAGMNSISIRFSEPVVVRRDDLVVRGTVGDALAAPGSYAIDSFSYLASTRTATWDLTGTIPADRLLLTLDASAATGVTDAAGNALDGEWADGADTYPSGDGTPGGDLLFRLNVLPGDANRDGRADALDLARVRRRYATTTTSPLYSIFADLDGSGRISATDLLLARLNQRRRLPEPPPVRAVLA
jgi:hypothetical protein